MWWTWVVSFALGVIASMAAWRLTLAWLTPKLDVSSQIAKMPDPKSGSGWVYKIRVANLRRREAVGIRVVVRARIAGNHGHPTSGPLSQVLAHNWRHRPVLHRGEVIWPWIMPERTKGMGKEPYPAAIKAKIKDRTLTLEDVFAMALGTRIEVAVIAADAVSGSLKVFERSYGPEDVREGSFDPSGHVVTPKANAESPDIVGDMLSEPTSE
jgi:hypothetical protein